MDNSDPLLSELCSICHVNPPKYRCPRCATRTCSLPCSRRHKLWSQCSGVRDPAAYLKRSELASEAAFDRDFNFITGIERTLERAERDAENRGIDLTRGPVGIEEDDIPNDAATDPVGAGRKRKHPTQGLVKGEAGFLRGAEAGAVRVLRAPRGMSRNTQNTSRWHPKHKCLSWTVEWVSATGDKTVRNALETYQVSDAYDRAFPPPKEARVHTDGKKDDVVSGNERSAEQTSSEANNPDYESAGKKNQSEPTDTESQAAASESAGEKDATPLIDPHRNLYFYLHRPRTSTKKPVIVPLPPSETLHTVLRDRTVLEFPTIYVLTDSAETIREFKETYPFILEEEYLHSAPQETRDETAESDEDEPAVLAGTSQGTLGVNIENVDEKTVMEVLKQDLFETVP